MTAVSKSTLTPIDEALAQILQTIAPITGTETVALECALHRVLAKAVRAQVDVPGYDNSAMDGYALNSVSLSDGRQPMRVSQRVPAGSIPEALEADTVARIFTGAPLPPGADAVVMQENCRREGDELYVCESVHAGKNVRRAGADVAKGVVLFSAGHRLRAPDIGMLAGAGLEHLPVRRNLRVALLTTGDELIRPGQPLPPGKIYNSNFYTLSALLQGLGHSVLDCGIVADTLEETERVLLKAAASADCVISSGGVSAGEEDHVRIALERIGKLSLWKLAIKPGKPFAYGEVGGKPFFGLPGNPVSAFVNFALLVRPCLEHMMGTSGLNRAQWHLPAAFDLPQSGVRQEYLRVCYHKDEKGDLTLRLAGDQSSGVLSSVCYADGLAVVPPYTAVSVGERLRFLPLNEIVGQV